MTCIMPLFDIHDQDLWPEGCNVNVYPDAAAALPLHADDEELFQASRQNSRILSLTLGAARVMSLRANWPEPGEVAHHDIVLGHGALAVMEGMMQKHYQHEILPQSSPCGVRINLTWRFIAKHQVSCPRGAW